MKGFELVKREDHWALYNEDGHKIAATVDGCNSKLSIKNCEAIANGYDLDELSKKYANKDSDITNDFGKGHREGCYVGYLAGFQKALELLGDKKFNYDHLDKMFTCGKLYQDSRNNAYSFDNVLSKFEQTEWDVEIVMDKDCYSSAGRCDKLIMADCIICTPVTYLRDENGCLILKRV